MKQIMIALILSLVLSLSASGDRQKDEKNKEKCMENLRIIGKALKAYRTDHNNQMPDWLSDLYPKYLQDPKILLCPADEKGRLPDGQMQYKDPKMPCSYRYQFFPSKSKPAIPMFHIDVTEDMTGKEQKTMQLRYYGDMAPAVRCVNHSGTQVINLSYGGEIYYSRGDWEDSYEADNAFLSFLKKTIRENPKGWEKELSLGNIYNHLDNRRRLLDLRAILEVQSPPSADVLKVLAEICRADGDLDRAIQYYQKKLKITPDDLESRFRLSQVYTIAGQYKAAREQCSHILRIKPDHSEARDLLIELDAIAEAEGMKKKLSGVSGENVEMHYLAKMEEKLLTSRGDLKQSIRRMGGIAGHSPDRLLSNVKLENIYSILDESLNRSTSRWKRYDNSSGLINNWILSLAQDTNGILWIGTLKGVCKYDSENFTPFPISEELDNDVINYIFIDKQGYIWFGSVQNGAVRYDGENFTHFKTEDGLAGNFICCINQDRDGAVWFASGDQGLARYKDGKFTKFSGIDGLAQDSVYLVMEDRHTNLWIGTDDGVSKYDGKRFINPKELAGLSKKSVFDIVEDRHGNLWFATNMGVSRYDGKKLVNFTEEDGFTNSPINRIMEDREGNMWLVPASGASKGVFRYDGKAFINLRNIDGLSGNAVTSILEDREGNIWFGHGTSDGLTMFNPQGIRTYGIQDGLPGNIVLSIAEDKTGNIWIATDGGGVVIYDGENFIEPIKDSRRVIGQIYNILVDSKNNIWFTTWRNWYIGAKGSYEPFNQERGLFRFDGKNLTRFTTQDGLAGNNIHSIMEDSNGNIWIGAGNWLWQGAGISVYDGKRFRNFTMADGLVSDIITGGMREDHKKNIWIGTLGGVMKYDGTSFTSFTEDDGLVSNQVWNVFIDNQDRL